jgi:hypothetical protein
MPQAGPADHPDTLPASVSGFRLSFLASDSRFRFRRASVSGSRSRVDTAMAEIKV